MSTVISVWNRAQDFDSHPSFSSPGDIALRDVLTFNDSVRNGGLTDAIGTYEDDDEYPLDRVVESYSYFGLDDVADVLREAREQVAAAGDDDEELEALELDLDPLYELEDEDIAQALEGRLEKAPEDFD
jgi:hypothetical protein